MSTSTPIFWIGLDVHKDAVTAAVFRDRDPEPMRVDRLPNDTRKLRRYFERRRAQGAVRACYEASGAGYVLQRALAAWGIPCELAAPSLIPRRAGERRKADRRDAIKIARDFRDDRLVLIHVHLFMPGKLAEEDRVVLGEYLALLEYKLSVRARTSTSRDRITASSAWAAASPRWATGARSFGSSRPTRTRYSASTRSLFRSLR